MNVLIVGLGKIGSYLANELAEDGRHTLTGIESDEASAEAYRKTTAYKVITGDGCDPAVLEGAGIRNADLVVATTGHDEDNIVVAELAKVHFNVPKVLARVNNPRNNWLFTREWGVDVAVSPTTIISKIIEEEMSLGDLVTLLKLKGGEVALTETTLPADSKVIGKTLTEIPLPQGAVLAAIMRNSEVIIPGGQTKLEAGDKILAVTSVDAEDKLLDALC